MLFGLFGCDFLAERELEAGKSTIEDVRQKMGRPDMIWEEKDGSQTLEFARGPEGSVTYMVRIGPDGRFLAMSNVLVPAMFARIQAGMSVDDVRRLIGKPGEKTVFKLKNEEVWSWRYASPQPATRMFNVHFDMDGRVKSTSESPDPRTVNAS